MGEEGSADIFPYLYQSPTCLKEEIISLIPLV